MLRISRYLLVVFLVLTAACSTLPNHKDDFTKKNEDFMLRVRWLDFQGASLHFDEENRTDILERFSDKDDLKVTDFTMVRMNVDIPQEKITVYYRLDYYLLPSVTVHKKRFSLTWESKSTDEKKMSYWRIAEAFPELP